jgi:WhiB family transcriptional regulator, redox-sensing transcriptional regulator
MIEYAVADWREAGACLTADPDLFFPVAVGEASGQQVSRALGICADCPVKQQCLEFAMQTREPAGIWGGTTPEERIKVLRSRNRRSRARRAGWAEMPEARAS